MNTIHRALSAFSNAGVPSNWIVANNSSGDSGSVPWGWSNGSSFHSIIIFEHEGDQSSAPTTSIRCRCSLERQDCVPRHLALVVDSVVTGTTGWLRSGLELGNSSKWREIFPTRWFPAYDHCYVAIVDMCLNIIFLIMSWCLDTSLKKVKSKTTLTNFALLHRGVKLLLSPTLLSRIAWIHPRLPLSEWCAITDGDAAHAIGHIDVCIITVAGHTCLDCWQSRSLSSALTTPVFKFTRQCVLAPLQHRMLNGIPFRQIVHCRRRCSTISHVGWNSGAPSSCKSLDYDAGCHRVPLAWMTPSCPEIPSRSGAFPTWWWVRHMNLVKAFLVCSFP